MAPPRSLTLAVALALGGTAAPALAQTIGEDCAKLAGRYDEYVKTADSLITDLVGKALGAADPSGMLSQLGIDAKSLSPEQAARKGAVAAISPPAQNAIMIYLLRANTTIEALIWKGCKPPG
jgi:hypothetical protein